MKYSFSIGLFLVISSSTTAAPPIQRFDGHQVIQVEAKSMADLARIEELGGIILNCHPAPGRLDVVMPEASKAAFEKLNLPSRVLMDDVQQGLDAQEQLRSQNRVVAGGDPFDDYFNDYRPYNGVGGVLWYMNELVARYPTLASMVNIGQTFEGRTIWGLRVTSSVVPNKPAVVYFGIEHAREWVTATVPPFFAKTLLENYGSDSYITDLVDNVEFFLIPVFNVDGYEYTWTTNRFWRKNRRPNAGGSFGVDLNRNWAQGWGGEGSSGSPSSDIYRGASPFSEPETQRLRDFFIAHPNVRAQLDIHCYSQLILWPFGTTPTPPADQFAFKEVGDGMQLDIFDAHGLQYAAGLIYTTIYPASGGSIDWTYAQRGIFSFSYELRDSGTFGFALPADQIMPQQDEIIPAMLRLSDSDWVRQPLRLETSNGIPTNPLAGQPTSFDVRIVSQTETLMPGTGRMFYRYDTAGPFIETTLSPLGGGMFRGTLPATNCTSTPEVYFSAQTNGGNTVTKPRGAPINLFHPQVSTSTEIFYNEPLNSNPGWTVQGQWAFGDPTASGGDPQTGHTGNFVYGYNLSGHYPNNLPVQALTSQAINCTGRNSVHLTFWRWLGVETPAWDKAAVMVSADNVTWTPVWQSNIQTEDSQWVYMDIDISAVADNEPTVYLRWTMGPTDGGLTFFGWNIDDIALYSHVCNGLPGDFDGGGTVDSSDYAEFETCYSGVDVARPVGCAVFDADQDNDVDCVDWGVFRDNWTEAGSPPAFPECPFLAAPAALAAGARYIDITPAGDSGPVSIQITSPDLPCLSSYVDLDPLPALAAQGVGILVAAPVSREPAEWGTIHLRDADIIPLTTYRIRTDAGAGLVSELADVQTVMWGDVALPYDILDIRDVAGAVDRFVELHNAPAIVRGDQHPAEPNYVVNIADVASTVDAFKGLPFPFTPPSTCP